jgi:hypothetical protein
MVWYCPKVAVAIADKSGALCHLTTLVREYDESSWFGVGNSTKILNGGEMLTLNCPFLQYHLFLSSEYFSS